MVQVGVMGVVNIGARMRIVPVEKEVVGEGRVGMMVINPPIPLPSQTNKVMP